MAYVAALSTIFWLLFSYLSEKVMIITKVVGKIIKRLFLVDF